MIASKEKVDIYAADFYHYIQKRRLVSSEYVHVDLILTLWVFFMKFTKFGFSRSKLTDKVILLLC